MVPSDATTDYRAEVLQGRDWITVLEKTPHPQVLQIFQAE